MNQALLETHQLAGIETARLLQQLEPTRSVGTLFRAGCESWSCAWSADNAYFAWSCGNNIVKLIPWNRQKHCMLTSNSIDADLNRQIDEHQGVIINTGQLVWAIAFGSKVPHTCQRSTNLNWSQRIDDNILATGLQSGSIRTWNVKTGQPLHELTEHSEVVRDLRFAPDESLRLVSASRDGTLRVWWLDCSSYKTQHTSRVLQGTELMTWLYACCWSPDARTLVAVGRNGSVTLWDMTTYRLLRNFFGHERDVCGCDFSPDGALLVTSSYDASVIVWDPHVGTLLMRLRQCFSSPPMEPNESYVRGVSFSHDGRHIASVSDDGYVRFWDIYCPQVPCQVASVTNPLCCRYSPDGAILAVGTRNGSSTLWLAPMQAPSLQHVCRLAIRRVLATDGIDLLNLPERLKRLLRYEVNL